jgi:DNA-binding transcriptional regulator YiaG
MKNANEIASHLEAAAALLRAPRDVRLSPPEFSEEPTFKELIQASGMSLTQFSVLTGTPLSTAKDWSRGSSRTPKVALCFLCLWIMAFRCETLGDLRHSMERSFDE